MSEEKKELLDQVSEKAAEAFDKAKEVGANVADKFKTSSVGKEIFGEDGKLDKDDLKRMGEDFAGTKVGKAILGEDGHAGGRQGECPQYFLHELDPPAYQDTGLLGCKGRHQQSQRHVRQRRIITSTHP